MSRRSRSSAVILGPVLLLGGMLPGALAASPAGSSGGPIYTCTTPDGRHLTSDRPLRECLDREQRLLNRDGSLRRVEPAALTGEERAAREAQERQRAAEAAAQQEAARRDRQLSQRYPDEPSHARARAQALESLQEATQASEKRLAALAEEGRRLQAEAEFYKGRPLPPRLREQLDANEAATQAQRDVIHNQQAEAERINRRYDSELERLRRLWTGAAPGR